MADSSELGELTAAMKLLPADEREALALACFAGLSYRVIANVLEVSESTVKRRIRSALDRLRQTWEVGLEP